MERMNKENARWIQRFESFEKAFLRLKEAIDREKLTELERNGLVKRFEAALEMAWKTLKDFLEAQAFSFKPSPKNVVRLAQQSGYIDCAQALIDGLELRNALAHDYSGEKFEQSEAALRQTVYPAISQLYRFLAEEKNAAEAAP